MSEQRRFGPGRRRRRARHREQLRVVYLVPNLITSAAFLLGFWAIVLSMPGAGQRFDRAALCIVLAGICDMLDGRVARATKSTSAFGIEFDSLSDLVAFGVAPAVLMYNWALAPFGPRAWIVAGLFALCAALRLARFNVRASTSDSNHYEGLPSTFAGGMTAVIVWFVAWLGIDWPLSRPLGVGVSLAFAMLALLMVSSVPYPSLKAVRLEGRRAYPTLVAILIAIVAILLNHEPMMFAIGVAFISSGPILWLVRRWRRVPIPASHGEVSPKVGGDV